ncbi:glycerophosphoryl diester phosphodiesterase [Secundilactobacillus oryzae JCM 18671]|uniref:Glycerophosphoryl diester phosphodiesterase n=1 Tax=Secundilactobacillus oryzae JCM 18671 TaxID=1291743 RepID=A0A081BFY6_9LACO|nr:glycerophosphodiester phosphodiesterase [Secundilactobacillus oryzae]GAK46954.1 glycerophosphoryl diester phosphodiesterase [Secundilactobacillus oryzae JCM 18671]
MTENLTEVIAHRGSKGTRPENTIAAFQEAIDARSDGIETDVHLSADRQLIIMHDEKVNRTTNGTGLIVQKTLAELKELDAGYKFSPAYKGERVPTLDELLDLLITEKFHGVLNIELKTNKISYVGIEELVTETIQKRDLPFKVIYSSFNGESIRKMHELNPDSEYAKLFKTAYKNAMLMKKSKLIQGIHPSVKWVKRHKYLLPNVLIRPWTVNAESDMVFCFNRRMTGIITDYPRKAMTIRKEIQGG